MPRTENSEELDRLLGIVARLHQLAERVLVGVALEIPPVAVDGADRRDLEPEAEDGVGRPAEHRRAHVLVLPGRIGGRRRPERDHHVADLVEHFRAVGVAGEREQVAIVDVGQLVAEDGGELGLVLEATQEPGVNKDASVGHGERI